VSAALARTLDGGREEVLSEAQYRSVVDNIKQVIFHTDARGVWRFLNAAWTDITGFTVAETLGRSFLSFVHPADRVRHAEVFQPLVDKRGDYFGHEARYLTKVGGFRWIEVFAQLTTDPDGHVLGIFGTLTDITERKLADEELAATRARLDHLMASSPAVLYSVPVASSYAIRSISDNVRRQLGYAPEEIVADPEFWTSRVHPDDAPRAWDAWAATPAEGRRSAQYRLRNAAGAYRWIHDERRLVYDESGQPAEIVGSWVDVTEHRHAEADRARLSAVVEQSAEAILITTVDGVIEYVNPAFERLTGQPRAQLIGRTAAVLKSDASDEEVWTALRATLRAGGPWSGQFTHVRPDRTIVQVAAMVFPVRGEDGRVVNYVGGMRDVTHERQIEDQLRQAQKMEIAGRLAGGVAHDFNNLITVITGRAQMLLRDEALEPRHLRHVELINETANRAAALTRQLLAFSRKQAIAPRVLDLHAVLANMTKMLRRLIGEDMELVISAGAGLGCVKADPGQIEQVVMNLVVNARDAMPDGGRLTIAAANVRVDEDTARRRVALRPGEYVVLSITDTGCGMSPETQAHVFEPFFTTKAPDKGTGLGLSTVYGIVKQSEGDVVIDSELGRGTTITIYLPRVEGDVVELLPEHVVGLPTGSETVLVAEDEDGVRYVVREVLAGQGYQVLEARDGVAALELARRHAGPIHLLLTDVVMPRMGGGELAQQLAAVRPETRVLFMSGYTDDAIALRRAAESDTPLLAKPFSTVGLARRVRDVLDAR
jgi:PAS domain S-box-containing protein